MNALRAALAKATKREEALAEARPEGPWRLKYHLMPPTGWLNDPNGLCRYKDQYHVFYQYGPFSAAGGIKFWGHYRSDDLLRWEAMPPMLYSDEPFDAHGAYSGSAVEMPDGSMYLYYTGNIKLDDKAYDYILDGREQNTILARSKDGIRLDTKTLLMTNDDYPQDMSLHVRDPKVFSRDGSWWMVLGARTKDDKGVAIVYGSQDGVDWKHVNTIRSEEPAGYMWECPDLFEMDDRWFLLASPQGMHRDVPGLQNKYASGYFPLDKDFREPDCRAGTFVPLDYGFDFYAPQTFWMPDGDPRRLMIAWMAMPDAKYRNPTTRDGWQNCMTQIREITCRDGRLLSNPIRELEQLRTDSAEHEVSGRTEFEVPVCSDIEIKADGDISLYLGGLRFSVTGGIATLSFTENGYGRTERIAPVPDFDGMRILIDTSSAEVFAEGGRTVFSTRWYPNEEVRAMRIDGRGTAIVHELSPKEIRRYIKD